MLNEASAHFYKEWKTMSKRMGDMALVLVYPLISVLSLGIFAYFVTSKGSPGEVMLFVLVGAIVWDIFSISLRYGSYSLLLDIWNDSMKHTFAGSSSIAGYIIGNGLFGIFTSVAIFLLMGTVGFVLFNFSIFSAGIFLANFVPVFLFGMGMGLVIGAVILIYGEKFMSFVWILPGIILLFSGIYYPVTLFPEPFRTVALLMPATHSLTSLRASMGFEPGAAIPEFWTGLAMSLVFFAVSVLFFRYSFDKAKEKGMLTRF